MISGNNPREIYFNTDDIFSKISEILEKNGLHETPLDAALKEEESFMEIVLRLTRDFIVTNISEKDFLATLQKQLGTTPVITQNIIKDLKEKIIPLAEKAVADKQKPEMAGIPISPVKAIKKPLVNELNEKKIKPLKTTSKISEPQEIKNISKTGPDNYREPI